MSNNIERSTTFVGSDNSRVEKLLQTLIDTKYKAFVVGTDMSKQQGKDERIERPTRF